MGVDVLIWGSTTVNSPLIVQSKTHRCDLRSRYPLAVIKSRAHTTLGGPHHSFSTLLMDVVRERGSISGLYSGCGVNIVRTLFGWGIVNLVYDLVGDVDVVIHPHRETDTLQ